MAKIRASNKYSSKIYLSTKELAKTDIKQDEEVEIVYNKKEIIIRKVEKWKILKSLNLY